jgi:magnesium-transporting ATPase (P-type)
MKKDLSAMGLHLLAGILIGYLSFLLNDALYSLVLAVAVAYGLRRLSVKLFNEKDGGWWFANGGVIYFFVWFIVWVIFFNL